MASASSAAASNAGATATASSEDDTIDETYGEMHRIVLQGLMGTGFLDAKGVKKLFLGACTYLKLNPGPRTTMPYIQKVVREINENLKQFDIAIKSASCELTGVKYYIFLITIEKPILKMQTLFSKFELELFQKCLDLILRKYSSFSAPVAECINMTRETEIRGTIQQSEDFIHRMIDMKYFAKYPTSGGEWEVTLGFRGIREFESILRELYQDVLAKCSLCKMLLLHGYLCPNCKLLVHKACYSRYVKTGKQCPNCKSTAWSKESALVRRAREVEEVEADVDFNEPGSSKSQPQTPVTNPSSVEAQVDDDSNMEMPVLEPEPGPSRGAAGTKSKSTPSSPTRNTRTRATRQAAKAVNLSGSESD